MRNRPTGPILVPRAEGPHLPANLSAHKSQVVLATLPSVHFDFTPTYSSWLNQVEIWFSKVARDMIARGIFTSVKDLARSFAAIYQRLLSERQADPVVTCEMMEAAFRPLLPLAHLCSS